MRHVKSRVINRCTQAPYGVPVKWKPIATNSQDADKLYVRADLEAVHFHSRSLLTRSPFVADGSAFFHDSKGD